MRRLSKKQLAEKDKLISSVEAASQKLENVISAYNTQLKDMKTAVEVAIEEANIEIQKLNDWCSERYEAADAYWSSKSVDWQHSDEGAKYAEWLAEFDCAIDDSELYQEFVELEMPDIDTEYIYNISEFPGQT